MANRIPSSLAWLIDKRARVDGEIQKTEKSLERVTRLLKKLEAAEKRLEALDAVIAAHPISQESKRIGPLSTEHYRRLPLPPGEMTACILECLRASEGQPVGRQDLLAFIFARYPQLGSTDYYRKWIGEVVKERLKRLVDRQVVQVSRRCSMSCAANYSQSATLSSRLVGLQPLVVEWQVLKALRPYTSLSVNLPVVILSDKPVAKVRTRRCSA